MRTGISKMVALAVAGLGLAGLTSCVMDSYDYGYSSYNYSRYPYGYTANRLPYGYTSIVIGGTTYWHHRDHYYRHYPGRGYVVVRQPHGRPAYQSAPSRRSRYSEPDRYRPTSPRRDQRSEPQAPTYRRSGSGESSGRSGRSDGPGVYGRTAEARPESRDVQVVTRGRPERSSRDANKQKKTSSDDDERRSWRSSGGGSWSRRK